MTRCRNFFLRALAPLLLLLGCSESPVEQPTATLREAATAASPFPLSRSADGRYLQDPGGNPFPILGRTAWFITSVSAADQQVFIDDCVARGFNAFEFHVINHDPRGDHPPFDGAGAAPFL